MSDIDLEVMRAQGAGAREEREGERPPRDLAQILEEEAAALVEHLDELRIRLIISLVAFVLGTCVGWYLTPEVLSVFREAVGRLIFVAPAEAFFTRLKIAASIGLLLSAPVTLIQAWRFVLPALFPSEKQVIRLFLWVGSALFAAGLLFGYFAVYPTALKFFLAFGTEGLRPAIVVSQHIGFFLGTTLSFGVAFQIPLVFLLLVRLGVFTAARLRELRRPALFGSFVVAAAMTPTDGVSQFMMAIPLAILYEIAVWLAPTMERKDEPTGDPL